MSVYFIINGVEEQIIIIKKETETLKNCLHRTTQTETEFFLLVVFFLMRSYNTEMNAKEKYWMRN